MSYAYCLSRAIGLSRAIELLQKTQQLETANAALRKDVYQCPPTSENSYEGLKWADAFEVIERDNAKLHNEVTALKHENAALKIERNRYKVALKDISEAANLWSESWEGNRADRALKQGGQQ